MPLLSESGELMATGLRALPEASRKELTTGLGGGYHTAPGAPGDIMTRGANAGEETPMTPAPADADVAEITAPQSDTTIATCEENVQAISYQLVPDMAGGRTIAAAHGFSPLVVVNGAAATVMAASYAHLRNGPRLNLTVQFITADALTFEETAPTTIVAGDPAPVPGPGDIQEFQIWKTQAGRVCREFQRSYAG